MENVPEPQETTKIIQTDIGNKDGQTKCPKCGSTDISTNTKNGMLRCNYCRHEFKPEKLTGIEEDLTKLTGEIIGSGAQNIVADTNDIITLKCSSCGAEVVIDTKSAPQARCHWCRNKLSINEQIPNGTIPDTLLPFMVSKDDARNEIEKFVEKRKMFAHPKFKQEFTTENIMGVFFPYMLVDANAHMKLDGEAEKTKNKYWVGDSDDGHEVYDADVFSLTRDFDVTINDLSVESSTEKLKRDKNNTNNVINAIMPFDTENCVKYNSNYLTGFTSEKRDANIEELKPLVKGQLQDVAKFAANDSVSEYDRGVRWDTQEFNVIGQQWISAYLPVWLYSYQEISGDKKLLHYVALNARTKEIMGSVPIHFPKLIGVSVLVEIASVFSWKILYGIFNLDYLFLLFLAGPVYFAYFYMTYRNSNARHKYEKETKTEITNMKTRDDFVKTKTGLSNETMEDANNTTVESSNIV